METIRGLILRLQQQSDQNIDHSEILATVQQLEAALQQAIAEPVRPVRTGNISVVFPAGNRLHTAPQQVAAEPEKVAAPVVAPVPLAETRQFSDVQQLPGASQAPQPGQAPEVVPESSQTFKPVPQATQTLEPAPEPTQVRVPAAEPTQVRVPAPEPKPVEPISVAENFHLSFAKEDEAKKQPLPQQMEMNDIFSQSSSLNDRMKADQQEIRSVLNEEPVKDLRRAIGINDRFVYLSELFRGDEVMYERSLKTINNFRIYPEAEYWIERELKVKMGWDETKETVKQFRQLVKRRFQV